MPKNEPGQPPKSAPGPPPSLPWDTPVQYARKVGPKRAEALNAEGISTVGDLLLYPPFRYEDRTRFRAIRDLQDGEYACVMGRIIAAEARITSRIRLKLFNMVVRDAGATVNVVFFNQPYLKDTLKDGLQVILFGKPELDPHSYGGRLTFKNPAWEILDEEDASDFVHIGRIVPIYRKVGILNPKQLREVTHLALQAVEAVPEVLPPSLLARYRFTDRKEALRQVHFPVIDTSDPAEAEKALTALNCGDSPAHRRMVYEEFFLLQAGLRFAAGQRRCAAKPHRVEVTDAIRDKVRRALPFHPTGAQKRVIREIVEDLKSPAPMNRLLQGDVGSGKTIVAVQAVIVAVENGLQAAVMAPTEILAEQHHRNLVQLLAHTGYRVALLKRTVGAAEKEETLRGIAAGAVQVVVGTHSVIQKDVEFKRLGLAIVDEQHRFGVLQRAELIRKGASPDILVMTATPIPRTLALTVYGDLSLSVIDEMPPGRQPVQTMLIRGERELGKAHALVRRELERGNQAFVVYPLIEESEKVDLRHAVQGYEEMTRDVFPGVPAALLHGALPEDEKDRVMGEFLAGRVKILVSTTVIEVGIDVPRATVMMVEHAERFGLAQLHQLRGRVGRGSDPAFCLLVAHERKTEESRRRLQVMLDTTDGFRIAEEDLAIRGPGEFAGTRQSGVLNFRFGSLIFHRDLMERARADAEAFVADAEADPKGEAMRYLRAMKPLWSRRFGLVAVG